MANVLFGYPNWIDSAVIQGPAWSYALPSSNLKTRLFSQVARSNNTTLTATQFSADLGSARPVALVSLVDHNLSTAATWRMTASNDVYWREVVYQSDWLSAWPYAGLWALEWEDDGFWAGVMPNELRNQYRAIALQVLPTRARARYWRIEINDTRNPAGYVEIGRAYLCDGYQPSLNLSQGRSLGYESNTVVLKGPNGCEWVDPRPPVRVLQAELDYLSAGEAYDQVMQMQRVLDVSGEVFYVEVPDDPSTYQQRAFPATLRKLSAIAWPYAHHHRAGIELKECVG